MEHKAAAEQVLAAAKKVYPAWKNDGSGFVRAVALEFSITLQGNADSLVDYWDANWEVIPRVDALDYVREGRFVVAGLRSKDHQPARNNGHVVVIIEGPPYRNIYPLCYGGSIGSAQSPGTKSVGEVWNRTDRDRVQYYVAPTIIYPGY